MYNVNSPSGACSTLVALFMDVTAPYFLAFTQGDLHRVLSAAVTTFSTMV